jgi:cytosine/adenosine deaminase-related metal-dependent hydrolase
MILQNVKMIGNDEPVNIRISNGTIASIYPAGTKKQAGNSILTFDNAQIFPGLINSHDHLDFNLFSQLGDRTYNNYTEWGRYIHEHYREEIAQVLNIPVLLRAQWGVFKNLLCGITTVVNHGELPGVDNELISVFEKTQCIHSVGFEKNWIAKLNNPFKWNLPVNIHVGEGIDKESVHEIDWLIKWNLFHRKLIGVHGVAMTAAQAKKFKALIWCPESNYFLLNATAPVNILTKHTNILFGTDSTLTGNWNIWDHLQLAQKTKLLTDEQLYATLNINPAKTWQLNTGEIATGKNADLIITKQKNGKHGLDAFFGATPEDILMVMHNGNIRLFDESLKMQMEHTDSFSKIYIKDACKYVQGDLPALMQEIKKYNSTVQFPVTTKQPEYAYR